MHISRAQSAKQFHSTPAVMDVRCMFDMVERNYEWQHFRLESPKSYIGRQIKKATHNAEKATKKGHYLEDLYRQTREIPGVGRYTLQEAVRKIRKTHHKGQKRKTYLDEIIDHENREKTPGPANYFKDREDEQQNIKKDDKIPSAPRVTYLDEVEYLGAQNPGIGQYNVATTLVKKSFNANKERKPRQQRKNNSHKSFQNLTPVLWGTFDFIKISRKKQNRTFSKETRFRGNKELQRVPSPQHYPLKRIWSSKQRDHFMKQLSSQPTMSIYYDRKS